MLMAISAVMSLVTIISIYREGGILKRLRATPLRPHTILTAHVLVKLLLTAVTLALMMLAGRRYYPVGLDVPVIELRAGAAGHHAAILSIGFVDREPRADGALRAADRRADLLSDDRVVGPVRAGRGAAGGAAGRRADPATDLRRVAAEGIWHGAPGPRMLATWPPWR